MTSVHSASLFYREGSSDKVYLCSIDPEGNGFIVTFAFGRRGTTLQTGRKTSTPVTLTDAQKVFDKLVKDKLAKGYTPSDEGTPYSHTEKENVTSGIHCQLANPVDEASLQEFINDDGYLFQEKLDGRRLVCIKNEDEVRGVNRKGMYINLPESVIAALRKMPDSFILDGEIINETFHVFDLVERDGHSLRDERCSSRILELQATVKAYQCEQIQVVPTAWDKKEKSVLVQTLRRQSEGVVIKEKDALYRSGRPSSGGSWLKCKFYATATCRVVKRNAAKRSVEIAVASNSSADKLITVGNVTIPANHPIPERNDLCSVRYLYWYPNGALYQPVYQGLRDDVDAPDKIADLNEPHHRVQRSPEGGRHRFRENGNAP